MRNKRLNYSQVEFLCRQLAMILNSGIGIADGLELLCTDIEEETIKKACGELMTAINGGDSLSKAIKDSGRFPDYAADMVSIGEMSGKLEEVLTGLADYYEERSEIYRTLRSAVLHPMLLLIMMAVVIIVLVVMVIPMFGDIFAQFDSSVNETVARTVDMAYKSGVIIMIVLLVIIAVSGITVLLSGFAKFSEKLKNFAAVFPLTRGLSEKLSLCYLTRAIAVTVSAGISPTEMLLHSNIKSFIRDKRLAKKFADCERRVLEGESFPDAIIESRLLPQLQARSLKLAYSSGCFEEVWQKISRTYSEEAAQSLVNISAVIEPTIIVILGVLIGAILLMLMIPLMNIMSVLG